MATSAPLRALLNFCCKATPVTSTFFPPSPAPGLLGKSPVCVPAVVLVDLEWSKGYATSCTLKSDRAGSYNLRAPKGQTIAAIKLYTKSLPFTLQADGSVKIQRLSGKPHQLSFTAA
jgi:hypothetical protein